MSKDAATDKAQDWEIAVNTVDISIIFQAWARSERDLFIPVYKLFKVVRGCFSLLGDDKYEVALVVKGNNWRLCLMEAGSNPQAPCLFTTIVDNSKPWEAFAKFISSIMTHYFFLGGALNFFDANGIFSAFLRDFAEELEVKANFTPRADHAPISIELAMTPRKGLIKIFGDGRRSYDMPIKMVSHDKVDPTSFVGFSYEWLTLVLGVQYDTLTQGEKTNAK